MIGIMVIHMHIKNSSLLSRLSQSGLNDKEALIYLALLELGGGFPSRVAEYTGLNRSTVYKILLTLSVRGIINEVDNKNKLFYQIEHPQKLIRFNESKIKQAENSLDSLKNILPDIENLYSCFDNRPKITYYEKEEGLLQIYEEHISVNKPYEMLAWANANALRDFLPNNFFDKYIKKKEKIGITTRGILPDTEENRKFNSVRYEGIQDKILPKLKFVSEGYFPSSKLGEITIYGDKKVSIVNFAKDKMVGTVIEDEGIQKIMKMIFELSWNSTLVKE